MDLRTLDRRTRFDHPEDALSAEEILGVHLPQLVARNGRLAVQGFTALDARPLTLVTNAGSHTVTSDGEGVLVTAGSVQNAVVVHLDDEQLWDFVRQQRTFSAMSTAGELRVENGSMHDLAVWDSIWVALLEGWPVVDDSIDFVDRRGEPLELRRAFTPDDDPSDIAHFLREAGYLHLRGWLHPTEMNEVSADIDRALPAYSKGDGRSWWASVADGTERCVRLQHFVEHSTTTAAILRSDLWARLRRTLAGEDDLVQGPVEGNCIEALVKPLAVVRGISDVPWHRDCNFGRHAYGCAGITVGISVTPGTATSGQLRVVAGSHRVCMPPTLANTAPYLPVVALPTDTGDLTVHLSCTLHEAQPPLAEERKVMYTGFRLAPRPGEILETTGKQRLSELRERAHVLQSQPRSPLATETG